MHGILVLFPPTTGYDASSLLSCPKGAWRQLSDEIVLMMLSCTRILPQSIARRFICSGLSREYVSTLARSLIWKVQTCLGHTLGSSRPTACPTELRPQACSCTIRTKKCRLSSRASLGASIATGSANNSVPQQKFIAPITPFVNFGLRGWRPKHTHCSASLRTCPRCPSFSSRLTRVLCLMGSHRCCFRERRSRCVQRGLGRGGHRHPADSDTRAALSLSVRMMTQSVEILYPP